MKIYFIGNTGMVLMALRGELISSFGHRTMSSLPLEEGTLIYRMSGRTQGKSNHFITTGLLDTLPLCFLALPYLPYLPSPLAPRPSPLATHSPPLAGPSLMLLHYQQERSRHFNAIDNIPELLCSNRSASAAMKGT
jgi:hypothetical protein